MKYSRKNELYRWITVAKVVDDMDMILDKFQSHISKDVREHLDYLIKVVVRTMIVREHPNDDEESPDEWHPRTPCCRWTVEEMSEGLRVEQLWSSVWTRLVQCGIGSIPCLDENPTVALAKALTFTPIIDAEWQYGHSIAESILKFKQ